MSANFGVCSVKYIRRVY